MTIKPARLILIGFIITIICAVVLTKNKLDTINSANTNNVSTPTSLAASPNNILSDNDNFEVIALNPKDIEEVTAAGKLAIRTKATGILTYLEGTYITTPTIIIDDGKNENILLSQGTYVTRNAAVISLKSKKRIVEDFCINAHAIFWKDYIIYNDCTMNDNRPWGAGEAASIIAKSITSGKDIVLRQSDKLNDYGVKNIKDDVLTYSQRSVKNEKEWNTYDDSQLKTGTLLLTTILK